MLDCELNVPARLVFSLDVVWMRLELDVGLFQECHVRTLTK
jgi:hypothetical protein